VLDADTLKKAAKAALPFVQGRFPNSPHTTVEALLLSGDRKGGLKLARACFAQLYKAERYQDALRILNLCRRHELNLDDGRNPKVVDEATYACLNAEIGNYETARAIVSDLSRRRDLYKNPAFVEWLALAARKLAMEVGHEPRNADSLMRRAIRMANDDLDRDIRLTILRVKLLYSRVFQLDERAMWLLTHINNKMLKEVSQSTLALFLDETAGRMVDRGEFKGAMKRLRRLTAFDTMQFRQARTLMRMARCRAHFDDYEGAGRYASNALHAGLRSGNVEAVEEAVRFLREVEKMEPRDTARGKAGRRSRGRSRVRADLGLPAMQTPEADKLFDMLQKRFDVKWWVRRRGASVMTFGEQPTAQPEHASVFVEDDNGVVTRQAGGRYGRDGSFAVVLMRPEGDDLVILIPAEGTGPREEGIVRILQADRGTGDSGVVPSRAAVVEDYLRRASTQLTRRGLNHTMEMLFTKDVLIYLEEEGLTKDEMADKLGVSRATLYRMYARCGLN
jgi:hypothetical protein